MPSLLLAPPPPPPFSPFWSAALMGDGLLSAEGGCDTAGGVPAGTGLPPPPLSGGDDFLSRSDVAAVGGVVVNDSCSLAAESFRLSSLLFSVAAAAVPFGGVARLSSSAVVGCGGAPLLSVGRSAAGLGVVRSSVGGVVVGLASGGATGVVLLLSSGLIGVGCCCCCGGEPAAVRGLGAATRAPGKGAV